MDGLKSLRIGRRTYKVKYGDFPKHLGFTDFNKKVVEFDAGMDGLEAVEALIHEVAHGVWYAKKLPDRTTEENAISKLAWGLAEVFRDNPGLATHIEDLLSQTR